MSLRLKIFSFFMISILVVFAGTFGLVTHVMTDDKVTTTYSTLQSSVASRASGFRIWFQTEVKALSDLISRSKGPRVESERAYALFRKDGHVYELVSSSRSEADAKTFLELVSRYLPVAGIKDRYTLFRDSMGKQIVLVSKYFIEGKEWLALLEVDAQSMAALMDGAADDNVFLVGRSVKQVIWPPPPRASFEALQGFIGQIDEATPASTKIVSVGGKSFFLSWTQLDAGLAIFSQVSESQAFGPLRRFQVQLLVFALLIAGGALALAFYGSRELTRNLILLTGKMGEFAQGDLQVKAEIRSTDEIGRLGQVFNQMTDKIRDLLDVSMEKVKIEREIQTAQEFQQLLLPANDYMSPEHEIAGFYRPAGQCAGDWWSYEEMPEGLKIVIADGTGHGLAPALLTSALKSGFTSMDPKLAREPSQALPFLNNVVRASGNEKILATLIYGFVEGKSIRYATAAHPGPFLLRLSKRTLDPQDPPAGQILGLPRSGVWPEYRVDLIAGDVFFMYTDGITEQPNADGKPMGEARLVRFMKKAMQDTSSVAELRRRLVEFFDEYRGEAAQVDDISFLFLKMK